jgi:hypothetical protein
MASAGSGVESRWNLALPQICNSTHGRLFVCHHIIENRLTGPRYNSTCARGRRTKLFTVVFYGLSIFGCKTVQFHEMQRESDSFRLPMKNKL